jgi:hypothetical protein
VMVAARAVPLDVSMPGIPPMDIQGMIPVPRADYRQTTSVQCRKLDGTTVTITDTLVGQPDKVALPSCEQRVPGSIPVGATIKGGPNGAESVIATVTPDESLLNEWRDCFGPSGLLCKTEVYVDGQRCLMGTNVCVIWWDVWKAEPERVQCRFGPYVVPTSDCRVLRHAYKKAHTVITTTDPSAQPSPDPDTDAPGSPQTNPNPEPSPNPNPGSQPGGSTLPGSGTNPSSPSTNPDASTDANSRSCYGEAWSWNPVACPFIQERTQTSTWSSRQSCAKWRCSVC